MWNEMMENYGREDRKDNDLFFTCSLIDYISRKTKNKRADVVNLLGEDRLRKIYDLAMFITVIISTGSAMTL